MKKGFILSLLLAAVLLFGSSCEKNKEPGNCEPLPSGCFKGRLEVQGTCLNYTIKVVDGNIDPSLVQASWQNPRTGALHKNVFALKNSCDFPPTIKEGDEFYFRLKTAQEKNCGICAGYYPTPEKGLFIEVLSGNCNEVSINK